MRLLSVPHLAGAGRIANLLSWASAGLLAGLTLTGGMFGLRLATGVPSLPEVVQDRLLELLPGPLFGLLIDQLQFWGKPLLLLLWVVVQTAVAMLLGVWFGYVVQSHTAFQEGRRLLAAGVLLGLAFWASIEIVVLPALGLGLLGNHVQRGIQSAGWSTIPYISYGLALVGFCLLFNLVKHHEEALPRVAGPMLSRRRFLALLLGGGIVSVTSVTLWRIIDKIGERGTRVAVIPVEAVTSAAMPNLPTEPAPALTGESPASTPTFPRFVVPPGISEEITPNDQFYVVSKNLIDPEVKAEKWSLEVAGLVDRPLRLSYGELLALPSSDLLATLECISNPVGGSLISNTRWTGVPLALILDRAGARDEAAWVILTSEDNYRESLPMEIARQPTTLLAYRMNGEPLSDKHGFPLRLMTTGLYGMKNPKWLTKIELTANPVRGYWERSGWNPDNGVETMARFDTKPEQVRAGDSLLLGGVAFTGDRGILRVEVSVDGGSIWLPAVVKPPLSPFTWVLWAYQWQVGPPGSYILMVRAVDDRGVVQTERKHRSYPTGATGYHTIQVEATI